jgi:hypothetical protein
MVTNPAIPTNLQNPENTTSQPPAAETEQPANIENKEPINIEQLIAAQASKIGPHPETDKIVTFTEPLPKVA